MPELPEVEVTRRGLIPYVKGKVILRIKHSGKDLRTPVLFEQLTKKLCGRRIATIERRAKYLLFSMDSGDTLIIHLGMTGKLGIFSEDAPAAVHDHLVFTMDNSLEMRFNDTRRFGSVTLLSADDALTMEETFFRNTGPEPFSKECSALYLQKKAQKSSQAVKTFIMNGRIVAGVGNIYANESLFAARIHPSTPTNTLNLDQWQLLSEKIREILLWAIDCGGSTINDFLDASGKQGYFQANFKVYGREGEECFTCGSRLKKTVVGGRASYFCPACQKR